MLSSCCRSLGLATIKLCVCLASPMWVALLVIVKKVSLSELRASAGVGLSWISPMGPLRFSYATPIRQQTGDKIQKLQFQIGTSF